MIQVQEIKPWDMDRKVLNLQTEKMSVRKAVVGLEDTWICDSPRSNRSVGENDGNPKTSMTGSQGDSSVFLADSCPKALNALNWENEQAEPGNLLQMSRASRVEGMQAEIPLVVPRTSDNCIFTYCPFPPLTFNRVALDISKVNRYFSTPVPSQNKIKQCLTPVIEMDLEFSPHKAWEPEHPAAGGEKEHITDLLQCDLPTSEPRLYTPLYQSCFELECLEIARKLQCAESSPRSPSGHAQNRTPKKKQGVVDVSTIQDETLPYESTPMKSVFISEDPSVSQPADQSFFVTSVHGLEQMNLQLDVREAVCQVWEGRLSEEPLPASQVLETVEELPSIEGIEVLHNTQDCANSHSRGLEKENPENLETVATPALNCTVDVQEPLETSVPDVGKAPGSFNVTFNLSQKLQTEKEVNQTQQINCTDAATSLQCANLTLACEMQTERLPEINTTHQVRTVLCHLINEGGHQQKAQDDSSSKECNGEFLPDTEHSLSSVKPHNAEGTQNESGLSLGSLTFVTTLVTSTPLQGEVQFQFMKSICGDGDSMHKDPNLSICSVTEELSLDTMVNQKPPGTQKLESLPQNSSLPPQPQSTSRRSLIPRAEIPARSMLPTSRRCLILTTTSEEASAAKSKGTTDVRRPLPKQSLGKIRSAFKKSSAALNRQSLAEVPQAGVLCQVKEAGLTKTGKLSTIKETDTALHPNTKPAVPLTSRLSKLPGHVNSQLPFRGHVSLGSALHYKGAENIPGLTAAAGGKSSGPEKTRPSTSPNANGGCSAKLSTVGYNRSSVGRQPAATGRNVTCIRNPSFRPHATGSKKAQGSERTPGPPAAKTQSSTLPSTKDTERGTALIQPGLAASRGSKDKPGDSADNQSCMECLHKENAKAELLCQLEVVEKKLADREILCKMHMEKLQTMETLCESLQRKIHSMETSGNINLPEEACNK